MKVKFTVQCQDCGSKTIFHKDITELEETPYYLDCTEFDENNDFEEVCSIYKKEGERKMRRKINE